MPATLFRARLRNVAGNCHATALQRRDQAIAGKVRGNPMFDDAHPTAMLSGLVLGMLLGMAIFAGPAAWHDAITDTCHFAALEAGQSSDAGCAGRSDPSLAAARD